MFPDQCNKNNALLQSKGCAGFLGAPFKRLSFCQAQVPLAVIQSHYLCSTNLCPAWRHPVDLGGKASQCEREAQWFQQ